jgi:imidazolonepropionase-like amidohydrolase
MQKFLMLMGLMAGTAPAMAQTTDTVSYSVIMGGNIKGYSKTWKQADGSWYNHYQFNDRGRGDSTGAVYRESEKGLLTSLYIEGVDYMKTPFNESFSMEDGMARWKNPAEDEQQKVDGPVFYLGLKGGAGNFIKAIINHGGTLSLLPSGTATAKVVHKGSYSYNGTSRNLSLVALEGLGFTPVYTWVDERNEDFANVSDWVSTIITGAESLVEPLLKKQKEFEASFFTNLAQQYTQKPANGICISDVNLFDAVSGKWQPHANVYVSGSTITAVEFNKQPNLAAGTTLIDGKGKTLLPGLWDMHTHPSSELDGILHIAAGVTNIRDMGSGPELPERRKDFASGKTIGPDISVMSGFIDGAGPFAAPTGTLIKSVDEGLKYVREYAGKGYQQIKLYSSIKPEWVKPMVAEAHSQGMRVCGHIPAFMTATQALQAGYDEITHVNMLVLNFFGDTVDTRSPNRFRLPAAKTASLDLNGKEMNEFIRLMKEKNTVVDPTVNVFEGMFTGRDGIMSDAYKGIYQRFPATAQRNMKAGGGGLPVPEGMDNTYRASYEAMLKIVKLLYDNKIPIVPGTDAFAGFMLHRELELYARAGIPNTAILQMATIGSAIVAGVDKQLGSIEAGKMANLVLIDGNPADNISNLRKAAITIKNGWIFDNTALYKAVGIKGYQE